jgi:hypothetical protein
MLHLRGGRLKKTCGGAGIVVYYRGGADELPELMNGGVPYNLALKGLKINDRGVGGKMGAPEAFAALHVAKYATSAVISNIGRHNDRGEGYTSQSNPDIDRSRTGDNDFLIPRGGGTLAEKADRRIAEVMGPDYRPRANAVRVVETVFSASPDWFTGKGWSEQQEYFRACLEWAKKRYGEKNVLAAIVHRDEKTPHLHLDIVPIYRAPDGGERLTAKEIFGGPKKLHAMHDSFMAEVGARFGLTNRIDKKKQKHISKKEHVKMLEQEKEKELDEIVALKELKPGITGKIGVMPETLNRLVDGYMINSEQIGELREDYKQRVEDLREEATRQAGELRQEIAKLEATVKAGEQARAQNKTLTDENKTLKIERGHLTEENERLDEKLERMNKVLQQINVKYPEMTLMEKFKGAVKEVAKTEREQKSTTDKKQDTGLSL